MRHQASVAHHVRGRMRIKVRGGRQNPSIVRDIAASLASVRGVTRVESNVASGSVIVYYDHTAHDDFHQDLTASGIASGLFALAPPAFSEVDALAEKIEQEAEFLAAHSETARSIVNAAKAVNYGLRRLTNNNVDLKVLLPLGVAVYALAEHDPELSTPLWVTMAIFSFNSFVALHPPVPAAVQPGVHLDGTFTTTPL